MVKIAIVLLALFWSSIISAASLVRFHHEIRVNPHDKHKIQVVYSQPNLKEPITEMYEQDLLEFKRQTQQLHHYQWYSDIIERIQGSWKHQDNGAGEWQYPNHYSVNQHLKHDKPFVGMVFYKSHFYLEWRDPGIMATVLSCDHPQDVVLFFSIYQRYIMAHELTHTTQIQSEGDNEILTQTNEAEADVQAYFEILKVAKTPLARHHVRRWFKNLALARNTSMVQVGEIDHWSFRPLLRALQSYPFQPPVIRFSSQHYSDLLSQGQTAFPNLKFPEDLARFQHRWNQAIPREEQDWIPSGEEAVLGLITLHQYLDKIQHWEKLFGNEWWIPYLQQAPIIDSSPFEIPPLE